ncbi:MAG: RT0821/Lpp0805 family surface protein [Candidatus Tectomicrobia bacterium]|nr:RT0821/Lpp0805 family surface protein [Candidatus Tectomicrobia bacterium]
MAVAKQVHLKRVVCVLAVVGSMLLSGCEGGAKQQIGTVLGAGLGAVAGSAIGDGSGQKLAIAAGALVGAMVGSEIGKSLDRADLAAMNQTQQQALESAPSGAEKTWHNPDSGNSGSIVVQPAVQLADGTYCRDFQQTVTADGRTETANGRGCRQQDGGWEVF